MKSEEVDGGVRLPGKQKASAKKPDDDRSNHCEEVREYLLFRRFNVPTVGDFRNF